MRSIGTSAELERRRTLAVQRVVEGFYSPEDVADFLDVDTRSVRRWLADFRQNGTAGLAARPTPGRPPKLTPPQEKIVCRWLRRTARNKSSAEQVIKMNGRGSEGEGEKPITA